MTSHSRPDFVTSSLFNKSTGRIAVESRDRLEAKALPLDWLLGPKSASFTDRVLARLIQSEAHEADIWLRDDYRQAFITVSLAAQGSPIPFVEASYRMYGLHPDRLYPAILARRGSLLGRSSVIPFPKKFVRSVADATKKEGMA
jgi:hypothetical protein